MSRRRGLLLCLAIPLVTGCKAQCRTDSVLLTVTGDSEMLAQVTRLEVAVGENPTSPIEVSKTLKSGGQIELDLNAAYRAGLPLDIHIAAFRGSDPIVAGSATLELAAKCSEVTVSLTTSAGPADSTRSKIELSAPVAIVGAEPSSTVTVTVLDANRVPVPNVMVTLSSDDPQSTIEQPATPTDESGVAIGRVSTTTLGFVTVSASIEDRVIAVGAVSFGAFPATITNLSVEHPADSSCVTIRYWVAQPQSLPVDIQVDYARTGLVELTQTGLSSSAAGIEHSIVWETESEVLLDSKGTLSLSPRVTLDGLTLLGISVETNLELHNAPTFTNRYLQDVGAYHFAMVTADLDRNGTLDLAVALSTVIGHQVAIYLHASDALSSSVSYDVGANPSSIAVADYNGDGALDIVTANESSATGAVPLSLLLGDGQGTFSAGANPPVNLTAHTVVAGDFDGDHKPDLAVASQQPSFNLQILLGDGNGAFSNAGSTTFGTTLRALATGDFNEDGRLDLVAADYVENSVRVGLGNGDGTFQIPVSYSTGAHPYSVVTVDLNGDHHLDLATADYLGGSASVFLGKGDGTFEGAIASPVAGLADVIVAGDFNQDGFFDLAVLASADGVVDILLGRGDGTFVTGLSHRTNASDAYALAAGDFDNNGSVDLAVAGTGVMDVLLNTPLKRCSGP